jgi:hypothetical protein
MAVAVYDSTDRHATKDAIFLLVVFNTTLYVPPLTGIAVTASEYTFRKEKSMIVTNRRDIGATYKTHNYLWCGTQDEKQ